MTEQQIARRPILGITGTNFRRGFERGERDAFEDRHPPVRRAVPWSLSGEELRGWLAGYTPRNPKCNRKRGPALDVAALVEQYKQSPSGSHESAHSASWT